MRRAVLALLVLALSASLSGQQENSAYATKLRFIGAETVQAVVDSALVTTAQTGTTTLTDATATAVVTVAMADAARTGGELAFTVEATDAGADNDVVTGSVRFAAQRKGGTVTCAIGTIGTGVVTKSHAGADMTVAATCVVTAGTSIVLKLNADTALTATTFKAHWRLSMLKGHGAIS